MTRDMQATSRDPRRSKSHPMRIATSTCVLCAALGALAAACTASSEDVRPPSTELFFPSGLQVAPDESVLFVANGNSELRYDSGTLSVVDIASARQIAAAWTTSRAIPDGCAQDLDFRETLVCDEAPFMKGDESVRIGNFATDVAIQDFTKRVSSDPAKAGVAGHLRVFAPTRGDPSISWADYDGTKLTCNSDGEPFGLCDDAHRLTTPENDPNTASGIPDEPFGVFVDAINGVTVVTHQTTGSVSMIDSDYEGANATIVDVRHNVFAGDPLSGLAGATGVSGRLAPDLGSIIYVGARTEDRVQMFTFARPPSGSQPYLVPGAYFFLDAVGAGSGTGASADTRGMAFSADGNRMYLVNRAPPSLQIYDTSIGADGTPVNLPITATDICRAASTLTVLDSGDGERVYVTCFQSGELYVINPSGQAEVEDILTVGRGPYAVSASPTNKQLYISNFLEDTISVVDVNPSSPYRNRVVLRIGVPQVSQ